MYVCLLTGKPPLLLLTELAPTTHAHPLCVLSLTWTVVAVVATPVVTSLLSHNHLVHKLTSSNEICSFIYTYSQLNGPHSVPLIKSHKSLAVVLVPAIVSTVLRLQVDSVSPKSIIHLVWNLHFQVQNNSPNSMYQVVSHPMIPQYLAAVSMVVVAVYPHTAQYSYEWTLDKHTRQRTTL